jgi:hypothetical protein
MQRTAVAVLAYEKAILPASRRCRQPWPARIDRHDPDSSLGLWSN